MTAKFSRNFTCNKCEGNIGEAVEQGDKLCDGVETVLEITYLGDRVSVGGGCEAAVTARTRCWWVKYGECGELLYGRRIPLRLKGTVYESYGNEEWCLKGSEMGILQRTERSVVRAMCGVQLKDGKRSKIYRFDVHVGFE